MINPISSHTPSFQNFPLQEAPSEPNLIDRVKACFSRVVAFFSSAEGWITLSTGAFIFSLVTNNYLLTKMATPILVFSAIIKGKNTERENEAKLAQLTPIVTRFEKFVRSQRKEIFKIRFFPQLLPAYQKINAALIPLARSGLIEETHPSIIGLLKDQEYRRQAVRNGVTRISCIRTLPKEMNRHLSQVLSHAKDQIRRMSGTHAGSGSFTKERKT